MDGYLWVKALHVISIIAWMAGMFYLPRLYVYHTQQAPGSPMSETFKVMERKLIRIIINPAMVATFLTGGYLVWLLSPSIWHEGWWHGKLLQVLLMATVHGFYSRWRRALAEDRNSHSERFYRFANEIPTILMIGIVILVIVKPF